MWSKYILPANLVITGTPLFFGGVALIHDDWIGVPVMLIGLAMYMTSYMLVVRIKTFDI
tara:strand:+ start:1992 stop:2168 length:177 start_codon:yes stop_codon:yes gene_type:complete